MHRAGRAFGTMGIGAVAWVALASASARAEVTELAAANVVEGVTNNALAAPDGPAVAADEFTSVRAGVAARYQGPRQDQTLAYTYVATFFGDHSEGDTQEHLGTWQLNAAPTGRTTIVALASGAYGRMNSVNPIAAAAGISSQTITSGQVGFSAVPTGPVTYASASANATASFRPTATRLWQETSAFSDFIPIDGTIAHSLGASEDFRHERQSARDTLTADLLFGYLDASSYTIQPAGSTVPPPAAVVVPRQETVTAELLLGWRRDLTPTITGSVEAGVLAIDSLVLDRDLIGPAARLTGRYQAGPASPGYAELVIAHMPELNVYVGQTVLSDSATLRALLPLDRREQLRLVALGTAEHDSVLTSGGLDTAVNLLGADVGLVYQSLQHPFMASLDYLIQDQAGQVAGGVTFLSLHRQAVMLTVTATWGTYTPWRQTGTATGTATVD